MLSSTHVGCWENRLRPWAIAVLVVGALGGPKAHATDNPNGDVLITPMNSMGSRVWGRNDGIEFWAECTPCDETCNMHFTHDQGLTEVYAQKGWAIVSGSKSTTQLYSPLTAKCPASAEEPHGEAWTDFKVVDIASLSVDGVQKTNGATVYVEKAASGNVTIDVTLTPSANADELHYEFMNWTGGAEGESQLQRTVSKTATGSTTVTCVTDGATGASGPTEWTVTVVVFEIVQSAQLWYFNGLSPTGYATSITLTPNGAPSTGTFLWEVIAGDDYVDLSDASSRVVTVVSTGASEQENDVTLRLTRNGSVVAAYDMTVFAAAHVILTPNVSPNPAHAAVGAGFSSTYTLRVLDTFSQTAVINCPGHEYFVTPWTPDYEGENWDRPDAFPLMTNGSGDFGDSYGSTGGSPTPMHVNPGQANWNVTKVIHTTQRYYMGNATPPPYGRMVHWFKAQLYIGCGLQQ